MTPGEDTSELKSFSTIPIGVSDTDENGNPVGGAGILGLFEININTETLEGEVLPIRSTASTDVVEVVDITNFLNIAPCKDCVQLGNLSIDVDGNFVVEMGIRHPFPSGNPTQPITGKNRGDLHVFNVEGLVVSNSSDLNIFPGTGKETANIGMVNADGYSSYLDNALDAIYPTDASIHPYKLHFDDYSAGNYDPQSPMGFLSVTDPPPSGNLVMAMGSEYDYQEYIFNIETYGPFRFIYAVECTYAVSADSKFERFTPTYYVPQH